MNREHKIIFILFQAIGLLLAAGIVAAVMQMPDSMVGKRDISDAEAIANTPVEHRDTVEQKVAQVAQEDKGFLQQVAEKVDRKIKEVKDTYFAQANVQYAVPFTPQAPRADWSPPFDEACEEASVIMVDAYLSGAQLTPDVATDEIVNFVNWQSENGYDIDMTAAETRQAAKDYYDLGFDLIHNPSIEDIQKSLDNEKLVIVPAAGRLLGNPYFTPPGPIYHMLVVIGYDNEQREFITNDPGTKRGQNYRYGYDVLMNAIHDWNGGDVYTGQKVILVMQ